MKHPASDTVLRRVQYRSASKKASKNPTFIIHVLSSCKSWNITPVYFFMDLFIHKYSSSTYVTHTHTPMIYLKEKYCFSNITHRDLLSLITIVITVAFKQSIFTTMGVHYLLHRNIIRDHTSFSRNPYKCGIKGRNLQHKAFWDPTVPELSVSLMEMVYYPGIRMIQAWSLIGTLCFRGVMLTRYEDSNEPSVCPSIRPGLNQSDEIRFWFNTEGNNKGEMKWWLLLITYVHMTPQALLCILKST